jgi:isoleucyl-tRNA synthetase
MNEEKLKSPHAEREERIQKFWQENDVFKKSIAKEAPKGDYTFYDGPPFATGLPHYGHIVPGTVKDVIPRWKTMQGYRVRRRWGWDCHGLPVENLIEKELDLKTKKDIIDYGVGNFNAAAQAAVMRYADEWRRIVPRLGRWVDMEDDYRTMDSTYTETVWWIFSQLYDKGLIYEGFKSMLICPRCETTLSNFEVAQGYKDITDISLYVKFRITGDKRQEIGDRKNGEVFLLAWTTTPWTLPGNVALAVNPEIEYVKVKVASDKLQEKSEAQATYSLILAKNRLSVLKDAKYEITATFKGSDIVGTTYEPLFDYYSSDASLKNRDHGWKVYSADFVDTETGTGIVHIAPAFGADDYSLLTKHNLPFVQHVAFNGTFKREVTDFAGLQVKPIDTAEEKDAHQSSDIAVIKNLAPRGAIFAKEKIIHSYPHCWRCDTPLLNYATSSWFVKVTDIKDKLVAENKKITWVPEEIGSARFGNWLEGARDWAISRSRFWGAPIPVWREQEQEVSGKKQVTSGAHKNSSATGKIHVIGSIDDLKKFSKAKNTYQVMRHGEAQNNVDGILSAKADAPHSLTAKGKDQVGKAAEQLKNQKFDLVFISPFLRTRQTTEILKEKLGWTDDMIHVDDRLKELDSGEWDGRDVKDFIAQFPSNTRFENTPKGGENYADIKKRMGSFLYEAEKKYEGKNILIITHETPALLLIAAAAGMNREQTLAFRAVYEFMRNAEIRKIDFTPLPHNAEYELDLHRPFIDEVELRTPEGNKLTRVPDVFDCWFESGSMPYGEAHYPFGKARDERREMGDGKEQSHADFDPKGGMFHKSKGFPADFIAEGLDQTRGWFYSMLVLGVALFGKSPYKKVIVNGLVLAEDGQKMSKSKKNFPDLMIVVDNYGADSLRYYLLSSPVVRGQDLRFSEKGVDEVTKKLVNRLLNVVSFYEMYVDKRLETRDEGQKESQTTNHKLQGSTKSQNPIDQWIEARLNETVATVTAALEAGELDRAARPFMDFTDDISTWYLRRSRDRFKGTDEADKNAALQTTKYALETIAKTMAPFMPFLAEDIWQRVTGMQLKDSVTGQEEISSVHLESWPKAEKIDAALLADMQSVRDIASKGLEARMNAKLNVRQPLTSLRVKRENPLSPQLAALIKDEVNVKQVIFDPLLSADVELDTTLTPELKEEGMYRELVRSVQDLRKEKGLNVGDMTVLKVATDEVGKKTIEKNKSQLMAVCSLSGIEFIDEVSGVEVKIGEQVFKLDL